MHDSLQEFHCVSPPDSPIFPFLVAGVDPLLITVLHRLSMRALIRAAVAADLDKTAKLKLLLPPSYARWCCSLCALIKLHTGYKVAAITYIVCLQSLFNCCSPHCCLHPTPCLPTTTPSPATSNHNPNI